jgi:NitT/TauT family transport system permease protein
MRERVLETVTSVGVVKKKNNGSPKYADKTINAGLITASLVTFGSLWYILAVLKIIDLPAPLAVVKTFFNLAFKGDPFYQKTLQELTLASLKVVMAGCALSFAVGLPLGIMMGFLQRFELFANTVLELIRPIPPLAWIPLGYVIFTHADRPTFYVQLMIVFMGSFFPLLVNTISGVKSIDRIFYDVARSCGIGQKDILLKVVIPCSLPSIVTGFRIGLGVGWMSIIAAEFVGGKTGIGYYIWSMYNIGGRTAEIAAGMIAIGFVSYLLNKGVLYLEKRLTPWRFL